MDYPIARHPKAGSAIRFRATDTATGLFSEVYLLVPSARPEVNDAGNASFDDSPVAGNRTAQRASGTGHAVVDEERARGGSGGYGAPGSAYEAVPYYDSTGSTNLIDPTTRRFQSALGGPTGIGGDIIERGGNKGDQAIDSGISVVAGAIDFVRSFVNKHLGNMPDDGTSDRRASTLNQKTGGDRGYVAIDSGNVAVAGSVDFTRSYTGKSLANVPDDGTSDRRAATLNQKTGGDRGYGVIDSGMLIVSSAVDMARGYLNKHLGNIADDGTSDRRAATLNQKTGGDRGVAAIDSGNVLVTTAWDGSRSYVGKHLGNMPDDGTSDRRAVTANEKTGGSRGYAGLDSNAKLQTGVTADATAADGEAGIESARAATRKGARSAGSGAAGISGEEDVRAGMGGIPVPNGKINALPQYDTTGSVPLIDPVAREILSGLGIGSGVKGKSDVVFGSSVYYPVNRHNENVYGVSGDNKSFGNSYENIPQMRVLPDTWTLPSTGEGSARKIEMRATNVTVSGFSVRAVSSTGASSAAQSENPATSLNGTPASSVLLSTDLASAYWNLANANATLTTYTAHFDVDTSGDSGAGLVVVRIYRNDGTGSTNWTEVASRSYSSGDTWTDEQPSFDAAMDANWDLRIVMDKPSGSGWISTNVTAKACTYNKITAGTETSLTSPAGSQLLMQAMEQV